MSYDALPDDATRAAAAALAAFGSTPLDFDWDAMAAVWATGEEETARLEQALVASGLLDYDDKTARYSLHQTVEAFLARRADPASYERHAAHYAALMKQHGEEILGRFKGDVEAALATLDREVRQCERGQRRAAEAEVSDFWDARLLDYAFACDTYFRLRGRYPEHIAWSETGRIAAQRQGRERDDATLLNNIALVYQATGRYDEAIRAYEQIIAVFRSLNKQVELAMALANLGVVYKNQGCYEEAIDHYQQSLEITRCIGNIAGTASNLGNLGIVYYTQGLYEEAIDHYQQSLAIKQRIGDIAGIARTRWNLGLVYEKQGDLAAARPLFEEAAQMAERIGMPQAAQYRAKVEEGRTTND
jgi:tetratricopeptide (TPR) repeat protein